MDDVKNSGGASDRRRESRPIRLSFKRSPPRMRGDARAERLSRKARERGFTMIELLVVIAVMGILISFLLPAIMAARESARRLQCQHRLSQLILAVHNYELAWQRYPAGTQAASGPIQQHAFGYHHSWLTQLLPHLEQQNAFREIDWSKGVYHRKNEPVRLMEPKVLECPSSVSYGPYSAYAGVHHDVEAPIDEDNRGVFILNRQLQHDDIADGLGNTLFLGEKISEPGDLGWMSGTRATLRNTGTRLNVTGFANDRMNYAEGPPDDLSSNGEMELDYGFSAGESGEYGAGQPGSPEDPADRGAAGESSEGSPEDGATNDIPDRLPSQPGPTLPIGGFSSPHDGGVSFAFGDGRVEFLTESISGAVLQQLGNRSDGKLLDAESY